MKKSFNNEERPRLPPGQHVTERFPVLQKGGIPHVDRDNYKLEIEGEIESPTSFTLEDLYKLQDKEIVADIHCVTSWSKFDTKWRGNDKHVCRYWDVFHYGCKEEEMHGVQSRYQSCCFKIM